MRPVREEILFCVVLAACVGAFFHDSLFGGLILSPADVLEVEASFRAGSSRTEPGNRLLMDPVLQFQPWLEFNRAMIRQGRLPLWNPHAGCGVPHLANGQSAVFDPFNVFACLGSIPESLAWMAAGRLWFAGLGMFLLARRWGFRRWGRWFSGLVYPFCGFIVLWLLYPVTPVAIWFPWLILASDRTQERPGLTSLCLVAGSVGLILLGGHVQTGAHVLLAAGLFVVGKAWNRRDQGPAMWRGIGCWSGGVVLGVALAAVQVLPLGSYLAKSPVWADRQREREPWWKLARPRLLDAVCTALPYAYGSQRKGHPNLARAVGVNNLNESAGGYAGLVTLLCLAPLGVGSRRNDSNSGFLILLVVVGTLGAFRLPPVDNLLRALPVLEVTDNRRLSLWIALGLTLLGGRGIDRLARGALPSRSLVVGWVALALALGGVAAAVPHLEPRLRDRADRHYLAAASASPDADLANYRERSERQIQSAIRFLPRYYGSAAIELIVLAGLITLVRRSTRHITLLPAAALSLTLMELSLFGMGVNPAISAEANAPRSEVVDRLRAGLAPGQRAIGIGEELPPNVLMRYGLSDPRNYDSVELTHALSWMSLLYEPSGEVLTSRRSVTWDGVLRARDRLREAAVAAVVGASAPPGGAFERVERVGACWIAWVGASNWATAGSGQARLQVDREPGPYSIKVDSPVRERIVIRETWDPGWRARVDGREAAIQPYKGTFMVIEIEAGIHNIVLTYEPFEVILGLACSVIALLIVILGLTGTVRYWIPGISRNGAWTDPSQGSRIEVVNQPDIATGPPDWGM